MKKFKFHVMVIFLFLGVSFSTSSQSATLCTSCDTDLIFGSLYCHSFPDFGQNFCLQTPLYSFQIPSCAGTNYFECTVE